MSGFWKTDKQRNILKLPNQLNRVKQQNKTEGKITENRINERCNKSDSYVQISLNCLTTAGIYLLYLEYEIPYFSA
jgi:hypothetical protein